MVIQTIMVSNRGMLRFEGEANSGNVKPGMLLREVTLNVFDVHNVQSGNAEAMFAIEDDMEGSNIDTLYTSGRRMQAIYCRKGDVVYCRIANGENISFGDYLESNGDGYMKKHTATVDSSSATHTEYLNAIVLKALEAIDMSDSSAADPTGLCIARVV